MKIKNTKLLISLLIGSLIISTKTAHAVIPPDFIFSIGTQIAQFFSVTLLFFTAIFGTFFQFFKTKYYYFKHKKIILILLISAIIVISVISSYFYASYKQKNEYLKWQEASQKYNSIHNSPDEATNILGNDENDQLSIGLKNTENISDSKEKFTSSINLDNPTAIFINTYYSNIANGNIEQAYKMSKKSVDLTTFKSWYQNTSKITLDKLVQIDNSTSSIELTLYEDTEFTRYGVLMTLTFQEKQPIEIASSRVKILATGSVKNKNVIISENKILDEYSFFEKNKSKDIFITNQDLKGIILDTQSDYIILDARENIEYENGHFPESLHIRFADLKAGRWLELPKDKYIYVLCWSGIRGKEVTEFLRTKKNTAFYLKNGADGWVKSGGEWIGDIKFNKKYNESRYRIVLDTKVVKAEVATGAVLVDTREPYKFKQSHIPGSFNIPTMYIPTIDFEKTLQQIPPHSKVITVCDGYVNCFDAKITGVELEHRGHQFLGRYNKIWEYAK